MTPAPWVYQLHIALHAIDPLVWRRVWIPSSTSLIKLHRVIQTAMGWTDDFDHEFDISGQRYGLVTHRRPTDGRLMNERRHTIGSLVGSQVRSFEYAYDLIAPWEHMVTVERMMSPDRTNDWTQCIEGANACPPPRVGHTGGYQAFLSAISNSEHEHHASMRRWYGGPFCPSGFDVNSVNRAFKRLQL